MQYVIDHVIRTVWWGNQRQSISQHWSLGRLATVRMTIYGPLLEISTRKHTRHGHTRTIIEAWWRIYTKPISGPILNIFTEACVIHLHDDFTENGEESHPWNMFETLQWHHNERNGVSNHRRLDGLLNRLLRRRSKKTSKVRVTGLCDGNSPATDEFP